MSCLDSIGSSMALGALRWSHLYRMTWSMVQRLSSIGNKTLAVVSIT